MAYLKKENPLGFDTWNIVLQIAHLMMWNYVYFLHGPNHTIYFCSKQQLHNMIL